MFYSRELKEYGVLGRMEKKANTCKCCQDQSFSLSHQNWKGLKCLELVVASFFVWFTHLCSPWGILWKAPMIRSLEHLEYWDALVIRWTERLPVIGGSEQRPLLCPAGQSHLLSHFLFHILMFCFLVPSWLLGYPELQLRTTQQEFLDAVDKYFDHLIPRILPLQVKMSLLIVIRKSRVAVKNESRDELPFRCTLLAGLENHGLKLEE